MDVQSIKGEARPARGSQNQIEKSLQIGIHPNLNFIEVKGWSVGEDLCDRYEHLIRKVQLFLDRGDGLIISFKFEMFNTTTIKYLLSIIKFMNRAHKAGKAVKIYWKVDADRNDEMTEAALDLSMMCNFDFKVITESSMIDSKSIEDTQVMQHRKLLFGLSRVRIAA
ncbi:SiaC family regulatory phosphoprotein [Ekhidna sp.]|uniref:SiaC family regulatory phosphoprotein n=1 Tax=Ekhidna sp. TaxID=2608089 RepID=UPI0032978990